MALVVNGALLLYFAPGLDARRVIRWAVSAIAGAVVLLVGTMLGLWAAGADPTTQGGSLLFSAFFTIVVLSITNLGGAAFRLAADTVTAHGRTPDSSSQLGGRREAEG